MNWFLSLWSSYISGDYFQIIILEVFQSFIASSRMRLQKIYIIIVKYTHFFQISLDNNELLHKHFIEFGCWAKIKSPFRLWQLDVVYSLIYLERVHYINLAYESSLQLESPSFMSNVLNLMYVWSSHSLALPSSRYTTFMLAI